VVHHEATDTTKVQNGSEMSQKRIISIDQNHATQKKRQQEAMQRHSMQQLLSHDNAAMTGNLNIVTSWFIALLTR